MGTLDRVRYGVYRIAGLAPDAADHVRAVWLALDPERTAGQRLLDDDPGGIVSHASAAELLGLGDLPADIVDVTVARRRQSRLTDVRYYVAQLPPASWTLVDGLPVTTATATIATLAEERADGDHLARTVRDALLTGQASVEAVTAALRPVAHLYGAPLGGGGALLDRMLNEAGLPDRLLELAVRRTAALLETNTVGLGQMAVALLTLRAATKETDAATAATAAALLAIGQGAGGHRALDPHLVQLVVAKKSPPAAALRELEPVVTSDVLASAAGNTWLVEAAVTAEPPVFAPEQPERMRAGTAAAAMRR